MTNISRLLGKPGTLDRTYLIYELQGYYFATTSPRCVLDAVQANAAIVGYGVGLVGTILVYEQQGHFFMHSPKQLLGRASVSLTASSSISGVIQTSFDFS